MTTTHQGDHPMTAMFPIIGETIAGHTPIRLERVTPERPGIPGTVCLTVYPGDEHERRLVVDATVIRAAARLLDEEASR